MNNRSLTQTAIANYTNKLRTIQYIFLDCVYNLELELDKIRLEKQNLNSLVRLG